MAVVDRRNFLKIAGAAALPLDLGKALAIPAHDRTGTIADVEHVIVLMQENRSFDHYFGALRGVRGFADPHPVRLPSGRSVWHQPNGPGGRDLLPFRPPVPDLGQTYLPDPPHGWTDGHAAVNKGHHDGWVPAKGVTAMTYHTRDDLPYQYALADAFTVCDNYRCSLLGPTDPNRYHMWSGWVGNDGRGGGPVVDNAEAGYDWSTYPERLERAGISWKVYQDVGTGLDAAGSWGWTSDPYIGNYGDNALLYFHQYRNARPGHPLADKAKTGTAVNAHGRSPDLLLEQFRADVAGGRLPSVSWIVAPEAYTEHPNWEPSYGSWYVSQVVDILAAHPEVWSRMALFVTYDEEGGFFDHLVPPMPPQTPDQGLSTVPVTHEIFPGSSRYAAGPYGLGIRVPMIVVSPWTRGGWVNSQLFDHTSLIRFLEARFADRRPDLVETNITAWRRAVTGDLTGAFDFRTPNRPRPIHLPGTDAFKPDDLVRKPDEVPVPPADQRLPRQERGIRPARALPYELHTNAFVTDAFVTNGSVTDKSMTNASVRDKSTTNASVTNGSVTNASVTIQFGNTGRQTAVFQVRAAGTDPRTYTVSPSKRLTGTWTSDDIEVHGPNGFFRAIRHASKAPAVRVELGVEARASRVSLTFDNRGTRRAELTITDRYTGRRTPVTVPAGRSITKSWNVQRTHGWHDLTVTFEGGFTQQFAGHLENGRDSITDPLMGGLV